MLSEHHILLERADHAGHHFVHVENFVAPVIHMLHSFVSLIDLHLFLVLLIHNEILLLFSTPVIFCLFLHFYSKKEETHGMDLKGFYTNRRIN
ncbi:hypothetical protein ABD67_16610 [Bacillus sonorensis]|uniref:Uncharacterized protein n=1 Tax=Bacillus sonorensis TaxID=119858 RepID=A0ABM6LLV7_9BACI|nr:hypothetical protein S101395_03861 [Bacillus sonorensis]MBG9916459.1 hypothetical protein [Bacillus sonorensis]